MREQIIYHGHTPSHVWQELAQRSIKTRIKIDLRCPLCNATILHTDTTHLRCLACDAPIEIYQHKELAETADTRIIYAEVSNGRSRAVVTLDLQCLSCEQPLTEDQACENGCEIQTYLVRDFQDGELYIKRLGIRRDANFPREPTEIQMRTFVAGENSESSDTQDTDLPLPENSVKNSVQSVEVSDGDPLHHPLTRENEVPWRSADLTVPEKIVEFLNYTNEGHTTTGTEIKEALGGLAPSTFKWAMDTLIKDGKAEKVAYNLYRLIT